MRIPSWLGDAVMAEPAISALAQRVGPRNLTLAGPLKLTELLAGGLEGARIAPARPGPEWREHDAAVLLTGSFRSALGAWRSGIGVRAGWSRDGRGWLLTHGARPPRERGRTPLGVGRRGGWPRLLPRPFGAACAELAAWLGAPVRRTRPRLRTSASARAARARRLRAGPCEALGRADGDYVLVNVGARPGSAKGYPAASWARTVNRLMAGGQRVVLAAGPGEEPVLEAMDTLLDPGALSLVDPRGGPVPDLGELAAWIERARLVITADAGPRHLAVALDRPLVVVMGPTDPRHTGDHLLGTELLRHPVPCGPCHLERCPLEGPDHHACMTSIGPDAVARRALGLLQG